MAAGITLRIKKLRSDAFIPSYKKPGDAGFDLAAVEDTLLPRNKTVLVKTGIAVAVPDGFELQIRPRSGLAMTTELRVKNSPGTVDAGYRGEVLVMMKNEGDMPHLIKRGDRIAQAVLAPVVRADFYLVELLDNTERGAGGFGSTGMSEATNG